MADVARVGPHGYSHGWIKAAGLEPGTALYHGTSADLKPGDLITPGGKSNFDVSSSKHVYATDEAHYGAAVNHAKRAARTSSGEPRVYRVEPTGPLEKDPDYAISGGSFRSRHPLRVVEEDHFWKSDPRFAATRSSGHDVFAQRMREMCRAAGLDLGEVTRARG